jgi:predicted Zn-dependent protease
VASPTDRRTMNADLERAKAALEAGRPGEADIYAWNALATAEGDDLRLLAEIAQTIDDPKLALELARRGIAPPPPAGQEAATPAKRSAWRRLRSPLLVSAVVAIAAAWILVSERRVEAGPLKPYPTDAQASSGQVRTILTVEEGVYLAPMGVLERVDVQQLANELSVRYRIPVATVAPIALPLSAIDPNQPRLLADELLSLLQQTYATQGRSAVIGVTDFDMYIGSLDKPHAFSLRGPPHYAVVSTSELGGSLLDLIEGHTRHERTRKLIARDIGFAYFGRQEVDDPQSLLRPSMTSVDEIDELEEKL